MRSRLAPLVGVVGGRGATMVEYALLIIAVMFLAAVAYRNLGKSARKNADESSSALLER
jgi:Flp pilus assembly pilin Flp